MSWQFVPASAVLSEGSNKSTPLPESSATSSTTPQPSQSYAALVTHLSGTMYVPSTGDPGVDSWIASLRASRANLSVQQAVDAGCSLTSGQPCFTLSAIPGPVECSWRTWLENRSSSPETIYLDVDTVSEWPEYPPPKWVPHINGGDGGYLPTVTTRNNQLSDSMQKWPAYARLRALVGKSCPVAFWEWHMGFPIGWTDSDF